MQRIKSTEKNKSTVKSKHPKKTSSGQQEMAQNNISGYTGIGAELPKVPGSKKDADATFIEVDDGLLEELLDLQEGDTGVDAMDVDELLSSGHTVSQAEEREEMDVYLGNKTKRVPKRKNKKDSTEKPKIKEFMDICQPYDTARKFRLQGVSLFLTYPRSGLKRDRIVEFLKDKFADEPKDTAQGVRFLETWIVSTENHSKLRPDMPGIHYHCYVQLSRRIDWTGFNCLDIDGNHGHYEVVRKRHDVIRYVTKDGNWVSNVNVNELLDSMEHHTKQAKVQSRNLQLLNSDSLTLINSGVINLMQLSTLEKNRYLFESLQLAAERKAHMRPLDPFIANTWDIPMPVLDSSEKKRHIYIWGNGNMGKTGWIQWLRDTYNSGMYRYGTKFQDDITSGCEVILLDEFAGQLNKEELNMLCDGTGHTRAIYQSGEERRKVLVIVSSNFPLTEYYGGLKLKTIQARFREIELDESKRDDAAGPNAYHDALLAMEYKMAEALRAERAEAERVRKEWEVSEEGQRVMEEEAIAIARAADVQEKLNKLNEEAKAEKRLIQEQAYMALYGDKEAAKLAAKFAIKIPCVKPQQTTLDKDITVYPSPKSSKIDLDKDTALFPSPRSSKPQAKEKTVYSSSKSSANSTASPNKRPPERKGDQPK
jgi:hypothetical protein